MTSWTNVPPANGRSLPVRAQALPAAVVEARALALAAAAQVVGQLPLNVDLVLYRGDDFFLDVTVTDPDGNPYPLTGYTATAQMRQQPPDPDPPTATFMCSIAGNVVSLHLPHAESQFPPDQLAWDVQIVDGAGLVTTLAYGQATFTGDVTRP